MSVVTHHEHTLLQVAQILLQPLHGVEVEVVGGLVEQQIVGMTKESLGQHDAHLLVVRQLRHHHIVAVFLHTEVLEQLGSLALSLPTVHLGKLQFEVGSQIAVFLAHLRLGIESLALLHVLPKRLVALQHCVHHGEAVVLEVILVEHRETLTGSQLYRSLVGFELAADGFQQGRFACSVGTDDAVDVTVCELQVHVFVKHSLAELYGQICQCYHSSCSFLFLIFACKGTTFQ